MNSAAKVQLFFWINRQIAKIILPYLQMDDFVKYKGDQGTWGNEGRYCFEVAK
jgi:hypothetical protein